MKQCENWEKHYFLSPAIQDNVLIFFWRFPLPTGTLFLIYFVYWTLSSLFSKIFKCTLQFIYQKLSYLNIWIQHCFLLCLGSTNDWKVLNKIKIYQSFMSFYQKLAKFIFLDIAISNESQNERKKVCICLSNVFFKSTYKKSRKYFVFYLKMDKFRLQ